VQEAEDFFCSKLTEATQNGSSYEAPTKLRRPIVREMYFDTKVLRLTSFASKM
jgi:hypothetical protein